MNLLYIHTHDTGRLVSPYGYNVPTPNYQLFCDDAMVFENAFCVAPTCSPSRSALLTGIYPHQNGMLGLAQRGFQLKKGIHLAQLLSAKGYLTALCGVQHEIGYYTDHDLAAKELGYEVDLTSDATCFSERELVQWDSINAKLLANWLDSQATGDLEQRPFFVSFGMHSTHRAYPRSFGKGCNSSSRPPLNIPNTPITRSDFADYCLSAKMADDNLGVVMDSLRRNGLLEKTIVLLTTDHGVAYPFAKSTLFDEGTGVLMAIRVPGYRNRIGICDDLVSHIDVMPTLFDLLGLDKPSYFEGQSFAGVFTGRGYTARESVYCEMNFHTSYEPARSVRTSRYKYIRYYDDFLGINCSNIDDSPVKEQYGEQELRSRSKSREYLFDLLYDASETNNLATDPGYARILNSMRSRLRNHMEKTSDPLLDGAIEILPEWKVNSVDCYSAHSKDPGDYISMGNSNSRSFIHEEG